MATTTKLVTYEEWLAMPVVDDATEEVVNGEIRILPPPKITQTLVVHALARALERQLDAETFYVLDTQFGLIIRLAPLTSRVPYIAVFRKSAIVVVDGYVRSAPELIIEVLSPANRWDEREEKLRDYESLGVPEFWVVSPHARTFEIWRLQNGKLTSAATWRDGILRPIRFPEAAVDIASIWPGQSSDKIE
jgi:Uma2 family endonuclease